MRVLITGGNGYIAKSIVEVLRKRNEVTVITRADFDLTDSKQTNKWFQDKWFDVVVHTAVVGGSRLNQDDSTIVDSNLKMYYNLAANKDKFHRLISFGSGAEKFAPDSPYGMSKKIIADSIRANDNFYTFRIFAVFDENELDTRFIKANLMRYFRKEPMVIHSNRLMDFFYMKDLITLIEYYLSAENPAKEVDCSYPQKYTLLNIAEMINNMEQHKVSIIVEEVGKFGVYCSDGTNIPIPIVGLCQGIQRTYRALTFSE
jgi:GDP-L-fucose synthase